MKKVTSSQSEAGLLTGPRSG